MIADDSGLADGKGEDEEVSLEKAILEADAGGHADELTGPASKHDKKLPSPDSIDHLLTHVPEHPDCEACQIAKMKKKHPRRRHSKDDEEKPTK